jgi:hypothetical protein
MLLNQKSYSVAGTLDRFETREFAVSPVDLADPDGVITFQPSIHGNHYGIARLIYQGPILMSRNARYKVNSVEGNTFDITLTDRLSGISDIFEMFPFSTKYGGIEIHTDGSAGERLISNNDNQWIEYDLSTPIPHRLRITYPTPGSTVPAP